MYHENKIVINKYTVKAALIPQKIFNSNFQDLPASSLLKNFFIKIANI